MSVIIEITRQDSRDSEVYRQSFKINPPPGATVAWALSAINDRLPLLDINGNAASHIAWTCGCQQKTCGICAMVIDGRPMLACSAFIADLTARKRTVTVEPLSKFPVIRDLAVDMTILEEKMLAVKAFLTGSSVACSSGTGKSSDKHLMEISQCMLCGCCFEICPNCLPNGPFIGPAAMHGALRAILHEPTPEHRREILKNVRLTGDQLCSRALSCQAICPAGISVTSTLASL